jgi:hypothetical protein
MKAPLFAPALLAAGIVAVVATRPAPTQAQTPTQRRDVLRAFDEMLRVSKAGGNPRTVKVPPLPGVKENSLDGLVKVWARRYDRPNKRPTDELVNLDTAQWYPGEYFVLCFQCTVEVRFIFANVVLKNGVTQLDTLLPNPRKDFLFSFNPIRAGEPYTMPMPLVMDNNAKDEDVVFGFFTENHPMLPSLPDRPAEAGQYRIQSAHTEMNNLATRATTAEGTHLKLQDVRLPPPEDATDNPENINAVAKIVAITEKGGVTRLTLKKRK